MRYNVEDLFQEMIDELVPVNHPDSANSRLNGLLRERRNCKGLRSRDIFEVSELLRSHLPVSADSTLYRYRSYDPDTVREILREMKEYGYSIKETADIFHLSRNTVSKWLKSYSE